MSRTAATLSMFQLLEAQSQTGILQSKPFILCTISNRSATCADGPRTPLFLLFFKVRHHMRHEGLIEARIQAALGGRMTGSKALMPLSWRQHWFTQS
jgi:hypothetical protein